MEEFKSIKVSLSCVMTLVDKTDGEIVWSGNGLITFSYNGLPEDYQGSFRTALNYCVRKNELSLGPAYIDNTLIGNFCVVKSFEE